MGPLACAHRVYAAALAATLGSSRPYVGPEEVPVDAQRAGAARRAVALPDADPTPHEEIQHAVPPPPTGWKRADKKRRQDRGLLAFGLTFTALCGAGAGLGIYAIASPGGPRGEDFRDGVAGVTGLLTCTVGALALATIGAARLHKRRGR